MTDFIFATGAKNPFNDKVLQRRFYVFNNDNAALKSALIHLAELRRFESVTVMKGRSVGISTLIYIEANKIETDWSEGGSDVLADIERGVSMFKRQLFNEKPIKLKTVDHNNLTDIAEIIKPKQPNFTKFQNNFKRRGR